MKITQILHVPAITSCDMQNSAVNLELYANPHSPGMVVMRLLEAGVDNIRHCIINLNGTNKKANATHLTSLGFRELQRNC